VLILPRTLFDSSFYLPNSLPNSPCSHRRLDTTLWDGRRSGWSAEYGKAGADTEETDGDGGGSWAGTREC